MSEAQVIADEINAYVGHFGYNPYSASANTRFFSVSECGCAVYIMVRDSATQEKIGLFNLSESEINDPSQTAIDIIFEIENPK